MCCEHPRTHQPATDKLAQPIAALSLVAVVIGIPLWLVLVTSAKSQGDALNPSLALPSDGWHFLANYRDAFTDGRVIQAFLGSVAIVVPAVIIVLLFGSMASWVLARRKAPGSPRSTPSRSAAS